MRGVKGAGVVVAALFLVGSSLPVSGAGEIDLQVGRSANPDEVVLSWAGQQPPYNVFRAPNPITLSERDHRLGRTDEQTWIDTPPPLAPGDAFYYIVHQAPTCGNGRIDVGEDCDYDAPFDGQCCSITCRTCVYNADFLDPEPVEMQGQEIGPAIVYDFNRGGADDLMLAHPNEGNAEVVVYFGERQPGEQTFNDSTSFFAGYNVPALHLGDFDEDGTVDLATGGYGYYSGGFVSGSLCGTDGNANNRFPLMRGLGDGNFVFHNCLTMSDNPGWNDSHINSNEVTDFDEDGHDDIVVSRSGNYGPKVALVYFGKGGFAFEPRSVLYDSGTSDNRPRRVVSDDITDNGHADILIGTSGPTFLREGDGQGNFSDLTQYGGSWPVVLHDMNTDGFPDRVETDGLTTTIHYARPDGGFVDPPQTLPFGGSEAIGDFDGDGLLDIYVMDRNLGQNVLGNMYYQQPPVP